MIGIFDSGSGGLTVLRAVREVLPSCDVLYFGDIKNAPYGDKSHEELSAFTVEAIQLLQKNGATKIISACNSVSASLALSVFDAFGIEPGHIIEMVGPTVAYFRGSHARIVLCATAATINSGIYQNAFRMIGKDLATVAIPELAGAIEFGAPEEELKAMIERALGSAPEFDVLVLGCTHYPLVRKLFEAIVPPRAVVFDPAVAVAERAHRLFWPQEVGNGTTRFIISKESPQFRALVAAFFPADADAVEVLQ
jgi:glutamate racemase